MDKRQIMKKAVELAKTMIGDWVARMALALKMVWAEVKTKKEVVLKVRHQPSGGKEWVAEIVGRHPKYKFDRQFINPIERNWSSSGKTGWTSFLLEEGKVYEVNEPYAGRYFVTVQNGEIVEVNISVVLEAIA